MTFKASFIVNVGQYEHVELTVDGQDFTDLFLGKEDDPSALLGDYHASLKAAILYGRDRAFEAVTPERIKAAVDSVYTKGTTAHPDFPDTPTDARTPQELVEQELGGRVVAVQERAAETPRKAWEVELPSAPKAWESVKAEAVKAQAAVEYPEGPPVESPKGGFPF